MNRLLFVQHAQSLHRVSDLTGGWTDTPLTELGTRQATRAGIGIRNLLQPREQAEVFTSDLARARMTAAAIAAGDLALHLEPGLRELNNGDAAGLTQAQADAIAIPISGPTRDWRPYPNAESWNEMTDRVWATMDRLHEICPGTAVVVSHGHAGIAAVQWWLCLEAEARDGHAFSFDLASISEGAVNEWGERTLVRLNDVRHLEVLERANMADLYRVIVPVEDIDQAAAFYAAVLESDGVRVSPGRHYFDCGGTLLACFDADADGDREEFRANPQHIYLAVADLAAAHARCQAACAEFDPGRLHGDDSPLGEIAMRPWGERSFYIHDPFGNPVCFVDAATRFTGS